MTVKTVQAVGIRLQIGKLAEQMLLFQLVSNSLSQKNAEKFEVGYIDL